MNIRQKIIILITALGLGSLLIISCKKNIKTEKPVTLSYTQDPKHNENPDCVDFIALWSSGDIAKQIGRTKKWVFRNYTVDLWNMPPAEGLGNKVGELRASSYARIIEKRGDDYMVESPVNQVQGWLSGEHVKTISRKNPKTRALCE